MALRGNQARILGLIDSGLHRHGAAPTNKELRDRMGVASVSYVVRQLRKLACGGYIERPAATWRGMRITEKGYREIVDAQDPDDVSRNILVEIQAAVDRTGFGPSLREIEKRVGWSFGLVHKKLLWLLERGYIERRFDTWRSARLTEKGTIAVKKMGGEQSIASTTSKDAKHGG